MEISLPIAVSPCRSHFRQLRIVVKEPNQHRTAANGQVRQPSRPFGIRFSTTLKFGLDLCVPIEQKKIAGKQVHSIGGGVLIACLSEAIVKKEVELLAMGIIAWHKNLATAGETTVIFRDSAFADDVTKTNLTAILQQHGLEKVRSL